MFSSLFVLLIFIQLVAAGSYKCDRNSTCGCSTQSKVVLGRIVGGEKAQNEAWTWMISLEYKGRHFCGASLISPEYAVTAAHCFLDLDLNPKRWSILAGTNYLGKRSSSDDFYRRNLLDITINPNYTAESDDHDIAVIRFAPLPVGSNVTTSFICLPDVNKDPFKDGANLIAIGWGDVYEGSAKVQNDLRQVTVKAVSPRSKDCRRNEITDSKLKFCAGVRGGGKDTCQSDSGGPLMAFVNNRWVLAGVTSNGYGCARKGYPGLYTRVSHYVPFIDRVMKKTRPANGRKLKPVYKSQ